MSIENPIEWGVDRFRHTLFKVEAASCGSPRALVDARLPFPELRHGLLGGGTCR